LYATCTCNSTFYSISGEKQRIVRGAVPSVFGFTPEKSGSSQARGARLARRRCIQSEIQPDLDNVAQEVIVDVDVDIQEEITVEVQEPATNDMETDCYLLTDRMCGYSIDDFETNPKVVKYYTGFESHQHFMLLFHILGPAVNCLSYKCKSLPPKEQLFLTLMKIRQAKEDFELSLLFRVSESTVSNIVVTWINFLYFQLKDLDFWPSREVIDDHIPANFGASFGRTRVILDATEIPINKPSDVNAQSCTFSSYKNRNTLKAMIGCTPRGVISYVSDAYGGSTSDRQIMERSVLLTDPSHFEKQDSIMADRGIMVQDLFAMHDVFVNTPTMLKGKSQLEPEEIVRDRRIASKRIHIERVIGLSKRFKILATPLAPSKVNRGSRIIHVCFMLSNFRPSIVSALA
jgi:hypothetical protein